MSDHTEEHSPLAALLADALAERDLDHLLPEDSQIYGASFLGGYYRAVDELLLKDVENTIRQALVLAVCLPSFRNEWAIYMTGSDHQGYSLTLTEATTPIWPTFLLENQSAIAKSETNLDAPLGQALRSIFRTVLMKTKYSRRRWVGLDGETYHFYAEGLAGHTWSPVETTVPGKLVRLCHTLRDLARAEASFKPILLELAWERLEDLHRLA